MPNSKSPKTLPNNSSCSFGNDFEPMAGKLRWEGVSSHPLSTSLLPQLVPLKGEELKTPCSSHAIFQIW